ncbi:LolA family protein [Botrimarina colliarenosi]|nr:hypothetical protein [Botrimarina colliarenosi]
MQKLLGRMHDACNDAKTLSADLVYTVSSVKRQQLVTANVKLMKPNFAKVEYTYIAEPAFPSLLGCDGDRVCLFTPSSFRADRTFEPGPFDPLLGAQQASALAKGGGSFSFAPADGEASNVRLWDAAPLQAFFNPDWAARQLYASDFSEFNLESPQTIDGVRYDVLYHRFQQGNIAGGASSNFNQRLYVAPDGLIHQYVLEFQSADAKGVQVARLKNVETNEPMDAEDFRLIIDQSEDVEIPAEEPADEEK